jgi:hypothetical protein
MIFVYRLDGPNWFVGFMGTVIGFNLILAITAFYALPRALSQAIKALSSPIGRITTTSEGITLALGGNVSVLPWARFRYIWPQERFILLGFSMFRMLHLPTDEMTAEVRAEFATRASRRIWA